MSLRVFSKGGQRRRPGYRFQAVGLAVVLILVLSACRPHNLVLIDDLTAALGELYDENPFSGEGVLLAPGHDTQVVPPADLAERIRQEAEAGRERIMVGPLYADRFLDSELSSDELGVRLGIMVVEEAGLAEVGELPPDTTILRFDRTEAFEEAGKVAAEHAGEGAVQLFGYQGETGDNFTTRQDELEAFRAGVSEAGGRMEETVYSQMPSRERLRADLQDSLGAAEEGAYAVFLGHQTWRAMEAVWDSEAPVVTEWIGEPDGPVIASVEPDFAKLVRSFFEIAEPGSELVSPGRLVKRE